MKMINAILIDPVARTVTTVQVDADTPNQLEQMYKLIGCELVEAVNLPNGDTGWIDEEGLLHGPQGFFEMPYYPQPLAGRCLITGTEWNDEGDVMVDAKTTIESIEKDIQYWTPMDLKVRYTFNDEQREALDRFAAKHGDAWKDALWDAWMTGNYGAIANTDDAAYLQQVRNKHAMLLPVFTAKRLPESAAQ